jgi:hypothetical protein
MSGGNYYVPDSSRYPIFAATSLFFLVMGAAGTINGTDNGSFFQKLCFLLLSSEHYFMSEILQFHG